jgi:hypothetical protein
MKTLFRMLMRAKITHDSMHMVIARIRHSGKGATVWEIVRTCPGVQWLSLSKRHQQRITETSGKMDAKKYRGTIACGASSIWTWEMKSRFF